MKKGVIIGLLIGIFLISFVGVVSAENLYVSSSGDDSSPTSWAGAWQNLSSIQWGSGSNQVGAGDILYIDEGRYEEPLIIQSNGTSSTRINSTNYLSLIEMNITESAEDGWIVITAGASDGTLDTQVRITGSVLTGKSNDAFEGTNNTQYTKTSGQTDVYEISHSDLVSVVFECNETNLSVLNACVNLSNEVSIANVNASTGSYFYNSTSDILYIHAGDSSNITASIFDYEAVKNAGGYVLDVEDVGGIVFDGIDRSLRFSFGEQALANGIIKSNTAGGSLIFKNLEMLYADDTGHYVHFENDRLIFFNSEIGKTLGNQAFSHSLISKDVYAFIINNTIWDGYETHGNTVSFQPTKEYYIINNVMKREKLTLPSDSGLIKVLQIQMEDGYFLIENNTFEDLKEFFEVEGDDRAIIIFDLYNGTNGLVRIKNNVIDLDPSYSTNAGDAIYIDDTNGTSIIIEYNNISNFRNGNTNTAIYIGNDITNITINNNIIQNTFYGVYFAGTSFSTSNAFVNNNIINATSSTSARPIITTSAGSVDNLTIDGNHFYSTAASRLDINSRKGITHYRNNYHHGTGTYVLLIQTVDNDVIDNIYNNIFDDDDAYGIRIFTYDYGTLNIYNNVFYSGGSQGAIHLDALSTPLIQPLIQNNIFYNNSRGVFDNSVTNMTLNYNIWFGSTTADIHTADGGTIKGANNITGEDPLFVDPASENFNITEDSPAIDSANSSLAYLTDYYGNSRVDDLSTDNNGTGTFSYYDIGAIEYWADSVAPNVTVVSPENITYTTSSILFNVTVADTTGIDSCWYSLNSGLNNNTMTNLSASSFNAINSSVPDGIYTASFYCNDSYGNVNNTETIDFTILIPTPTEEETSQSSGGGTQIYHLTASDLSSGYTKQLGKFWKLKFDVKNESHQLKIDSINLTNKTATITISSDPQTKILSLGEEWKVNLNNNSYYDLLVRLENITSIRANVFIQEINEEIESETIEEDITPSEEIIEDEVTETNRGLILGEIFIVLVLIIWALLIGKKHLKKK